MLPLLVLEIAFRSLGPILPGYYRTGTSLVPHPVFGHFLQPNFVGWRKSPEFVVQERINSKGLRERELPYAKPPAVSRILMLGDSYVAGLQVEEDQMVSRRLERLLNERSNGRPAQVINAGVNGYGTAQEWLFFQAEGHRYAPDLVLLVFYVGNDVRNNSAELDSDRRRRTIPYFTLDEDDQLKPVPFRARRETGPEVIDPVRRALRGSLIFNVIETGLLEKLEYSVPDTAYSWSKNGRRVARSPRPPTSAPDTAYSWSKNEAIFLTRDSRAWREGWEITEALLAALKRDVEALGAHLVLVAAPRDLQVRTSEWERLLRENGLSTQDFDLDKPNRLLGEIAQRLDLPLIDLLPAFRQVESASPGTLFLPQDRHWTARGHAVAGETIYQQLAPVEAVR